MPYIANSTVDYRFSTHCHPYVQQLLERLVAGSVSALEEADTHEPAFRRDLFTNVDYQPTNLVSKRPIAELEFSSEGAYASTTGSCSSTSRSRLPSTSAATAGTRKRNAGSTTSSTRRTTATADTRSGSGRSRPFRGPTVVESIEEILPNLSTGADLEAAGRRPSTRSGRGRTPRSAPRGRSVPADRLHVQDGHGLPGQPDRLGRHAVPAGHRREHRRGDPAVRARRQPARPPPPGGPGKGCAAAADLRQPAGAASTRCGNALRAVETSDCRSTCSPGCRPGSDDAPLAAVQQRRRARCTSAFRATTGCWSTGTRWRTGSSRSATAWTSTGVFRQLPLFDPPIDPAMLARGRRGRPRRRRVVAGLSQPLPLVRFPVLLAKAAELCQEVKALGGLLLSAIEKQDAEALAVAAGPARDGGPGAGRVGAVRAVAGVDQELREALCVSLEIARTR